jgi:hypothetical protein
MFGGQEIMTGGVLSSTNMDCVQEAEFPQSSKARHVRVIVNSWGHAPAAVTSLEDIVGVVSQLSVAVAVPVAPGAVLVLHWTVTFAGQVMTGTMLSRTLKICVQVVVLTPSVMV